MSPYVVWLTVAGVGMVLVGEGLRRRARARHVWLSGLGAEDDR